MMTPEQRRALIARTMIDEGDRVHHNGRHGNIYKPRKPVDWTEILYWIGMALLTAGAAALFCSL